ncbi:MAG TPA: hypothetical protein VFD33_00265, partial [Bacillota bacterium]|nr:hypothetical protein [Bacillota bacterium]
VYSEYTFAIKQGRQDIVDVEAILLAAQGQAERNGFTVDSYDREDYLGFTAYKSIEGLDLDQPGPAILGFDDLPSIFKELDWQRQTGVFEDHYSFSLLVDLNDIIDKQAIEGLPLDLKEEAYGAIEASSFTFNFTMMGKPTDTNADRVSENRTSTSYRWTLDYGQEMTLYIEAGHDKTSTRDIILILVSIAFLLVVTIFALLLLYKKFKKNE